MTRLQSLARRWLAAAGCTLLLAAAPTAQAGPLSFFSFESEGNLQLFDAGSGSWNGRITEFPDPAAPPTTPLTLASLVLFKFDAAAAKQLTGQFKFINVADLSSTVFGTLTGAFTDPADTLLSGGEFGLDYLIQGGTGQFAGYRGFGLSFLQFDPNATSFNNYAEQGLLVAAVPEPGALWLVALGLAALAWAPRRRRQTT